MTTDTQHPVRDPHIRRSSIQDHIALLHRACSWLGISDGRASAYSQLLIELSRNNMSSEHTLSVNESYEITEIYELWRDHVDNFPGLEGKIREIFRSGPILSEYEKPTNSGNRSRNDAFPLLIAGRILAAGIEVITVDNIPARGKTCDSDTDVRLSVEGHVVDIQCKRARSERAIIGRVDEALGQLRTSSMKGYFGCIAVDCSAFIRRPHTVIESQSLEMSAKLVYDELARLAGQVNRRRYHENPMLIGAFFAANVPAMTIAGRSTIVGPNHKPYTYFNTDSVRNMVGVINVASPNHRLFEIIGMALDRNSRLNWKK